MPEKEFLHQLRHGDETAYKELVARFQESVYNTALNFLQNAEDAEDTAQEVFIQVYHSVKQFKENAQLSTWIYRITVTKCLDHLRNRKRKKRFAFVTGLFSDKNTLLHENIEFNHPGLMLDQKQDAAILYKAIDLLPEKQRTAFLLNKTEQLSYMQIATILDTTEAAVDALLQRAKQNLRKRIEQNFKSKN